MKAGSTSGDASRSPESGGGVVRTLLRVPLFYKILIANAVILALVTIGSADYPPLEPAPGRYVKVKAN